MSTANRTGNILQNKEISYGAWEWSQEAVISGTQAPPPSPVSLTLSLAPLKVMVVPGAKLGGSVHSWARWQELKTQEGGFSRGIETKLV